MTFEDIYLEILEKISNNKNVNIGEYCIRYPEYAESLKSKFEVCKFIKNNFDDGLNVQRLGEYSILQELGRGGMGVVYLAAQPSISRLVVIKVLPPSFLHDKDALKNFQEEATTIAKFNHPNIIPIFSFGEEKGVYYIVMSYIAGISLKELIEKIKYIPNIKNVKISAIKEKLTPHSTNQDSTQKSITLKRDSKFWDKSYYQFIALIGSEIAEAISYAHQNGIFHGDLKPSNILLNHESIPLVVDFGLSQNIKMSLDSKSKEFSGTLFYAAPEQIKNNAINEKTDIWSLGITLYELLTLKKPFTDKSIEKTAAKITKNEPALLKSRDKKIPIELEAITLKCLEKKPENRYASALDLSKDLHNYLELKPISAKPYGPLKRLWKAALRKPIVAILITTLIPVSIFAFILGTNKLIDHYLTKATMLLNEYKTTEALKIYVNLNRISKYYPYAKYVTTESLIELGMYCVNHEDYDKSLKIFQFASTNNPKDIRILQGIGYCYHGKGMYEEALKTYRECLNIEPNNHDILKAIADVLFAQKVELGDVMALVNFDMKWSLSNKQGWLIQKALAANYKLGEYIGTSLSSSKAVEAKIENASIDILANIRAGYKMEEAGLYDEAIAIYTKSIESDPSNWKAYVDRGGTYGKGEKDYEKAIQDFKKATELAPYSDLAYEGLALTYLNKGLLDEALLNYNKALELKPSNVNSHIGRGVIFHRKKLYNKAIDEYNKALQIDENNANAYLSRSTVYYDKRDYSKAWQDVKKAQLLNGQIPPDFIEALSKASGLSK